ncbi:MAG: hypothetical protein CMP81_16420 [Fulvimarina sp.]|nr:hypothetical protein [Fulvimarina sp.]
MTAIRHLYWDSCVFLAYLNDERSSYGNAIDYIYQFLDEARQGECAIYSSSLTLAEITRKHLLNNSFGSFEDFLKDFQGAVILVDPSPPIMLTAGHLRGMEYTKGSGKRPLATPDAIHLATALALEGYGVSLTALHSFDRGRGGKYVPIVGFEDWCGGCMNDFVVSRVVAMNREPPIHPSPMLNVGTAKRPRRAIDLR